MSERINDDGFLKKLLDQLKQEDSVVRAQLNDQRLYKLAEYDATKGYMHMKVTPDDLQNRFLELKGLVKRGEYTLKNLEDDVYNRWGINEDPREDMLRKEKTGQIKPTIVTGFSINDIAVADIPENSEENH